MLHGGNKKEPKKALLGGDNGLDYYHLLFKQIRIAKIKTPLFIICEIDESQSKKITEIIKKELPQADFKIEKDLSGFDRLVTISKFSPEQKTLQIKNQF